jgi:hypothetical protein
MWGSGEIRVAGRPGHPHNAEQETAAPPRNLEIVVVWQALTRAPNARLSTWERTDADGNHSAQVLSETNRLTF